MKLTVEKLVVYRGDRRVIEDLSFSLKAGETLIVLGPNGAGKTTLIRALCGFIIPRSGMIALDAANIEPETPVGESCHYVGHASGTKSSLTVRENLRFWCAYFDANGASSSNVSTDRALEHFNLMELAGIPAGYLSAGQKRRLGLARLLVAQRPIWLLDEPTVSLDAESVSLLARAIKIHVESGGLVVAATHIPLGIKDARELRLAHARTQVAG